MKEDSQEHVTLVVVNKEPLFFNHRDGPYMPTLKVLHKCKFLIGGTILTQLIWNHKSDPNIMAKFQVDKGGIKFVLGGAHVMCPGLTSAGGRMEDVDEGAAVVCPHKPSFPLHTLTFEWLSQALMAEGKEHALAIGITVMKSSAIREINKGIGLESAHYLGDGLWKAGNMS